MYELKEKKIKPDQMNPLIMPLGNDLLAFFKIVEAEVYKKLSQGKKEGWTPDQLINEIDSLFEDEGIKNA